MFWRPRAAKSCQNIILRRKALKEWSLENVDFLSKIFHESDFAITSNGRTVFELGSLHVPMIVIPVNKRENTHNFVEKYNVGYILKNLNESTSEEFHNIFKSMFKYQNRQKFLENFDWKLD